MKNCICIVFWHNNQSYFEELRKIPNLEVFVISHQPPNNVPQWLYSYVNVDHLFFEKNLGYDWGSYQQFLNKKLYENYSIVFFTHDDILIKDISGFDRCIDIIYSKQGNCVVGNGLNDTKRDWPKTHIQSYAHSRWKPPSWEFCHDTVRGSFFATSTTALSKIESFEVYWDRRKFLGVGAGNWSLRATCGKIQEILGENSFQFLCENYRDSPYITELVRGELNDHTGDRKKAPSINNLIVYRISRFLMTRYMDCNNKNSKLFFSKLMSVIYNSI